MNVERCTFVTVGVKTINAKAKTNGSKAAANAKGAKPQGKRVVKESAKRNTVKAMLRGFYWFLMVGIVCTVIFVIFEIFKAYDEGRREQEMQKQRDESAMVIEVEPVKDLYRV